MPDSILTSIKKVLGIAEDYTVFDPEITLHINSTLSTLNQLGIGPDSGFMVNDKTDTWSSFIGSDPKLNSVKTYVFLQVKLLFDPPATSYLVTAYQEQLKELAWRLNVVREEVSWIDPDPEPIYTPPLFDGGTPDHQSSTIVDGGSP